MASSPASLGALAALLSSGVKTLEDAYAKQGRVYPSLDSPFIPGPLDENHDVVNTSRLVVAAAYQIIASVRNPLESIQDHATGSYNSAALGLVNDIHIANILNEAGEQGLHTNDISKHTDVAPDRLARILRYLATRHIFREVRPDVFANNRVSSMLIKNHNIEEIKKSPETEYEGSPAAAFVSHTTDECMKGAVSIAPWIRDNSNKYFSPFNMSIKSSLNLFEWYALPENHARGRRTQIAFTGGGERFPPETFTGALEWESLPKGAVVVDVGAGVGSVTHTLAKRYPQLHYIVQDVKDVIEKDAPKYWEDKLPSALTERRVELQTINFFESQPVKGADVYFMRLVLHDWPDNLCENILKIIRSAASPRSKLIVFESIMTYSCNYDGPFAEVSNPAQPPAGLLANLGMGAGGFLTMIDIQMLNIFNGKERTISEFIELGNSAGWKLESAKGGIMSSMVFSAM